jgi:hypothetical protein
MTNRSRGVSVRITHEPKRVLAKRIMGGRSLEFSEPQRTSGNVGTDGT